MKSHSRLVWIVVLFLGWLLDFLFWKQAPGINFAIYAAVCLVSGFLLLRIGGTHPAPRAIWLVPLMAFFAITTFVRGEPLTLFLGVVFTLFLMATLAVSYADGRWLEFGVADYFIRFLRLAWSMVSRPIGFGSRGAGAAAVGTSSTSKFWPVVRGIILTIPVLLLFGVLLASADLVFQQEVDSIVKLFRIERLPEYAFRLLFILAAAWALLGVVLHAADQNRAAALIADRVPAAARLLGFIEASVVLSGLVVLFSAFVLVQFRYFFGGAENIGLQGYTYAEYARRGYGELMAVAFLSLLLLLGLGAVTRRDSIRQQRLFSGLSIAVVLLVAIMLVSAYMRLGLYEMAYGFTRLRTYVHVSLIWLGALLGAVVILEAVHRERWFASVALASALGFGLTLALLNVDAFIVRQNVARAQGEQALDVAYLASLSTDAVPPLVHVFKSDSALPGTKEAVGASLACGWGGNQERSPTDWRSFSLSRFLADRAFALAESELQRYRVVNGDQVTVVRSPEGHYFDCTDSKE